MKWLKSFINPRLKKIKTVNNGLNLACLYQNVNDMEIKGWTLIIFVCFNIIQLYFQNLRKSYLFKLSSRPDKEVLVLFKVFSSVLKGFPLPLLPMAWSKRSVGLLVLDSIKLLSDDVHCKNKKYKICNNNSNNNDFSIRLPVCLSKMYLKLRS